MGDEYITIQQGEATVTTAAVTFLGIGSAGTVGACRRLVFPSAVSPFLAPIVYSAAGKCLNPSRTLNLDNAVLPAPTGEVVKTLGSTRVVRFDEATEDVIVTEIWAGQAGASMPTALFRQLYEYWINAPEFALAQTEFIQWEPRDRTAVVYDVEIVRLTVGGRGGLDVADLRDPGGQFGGGDFDNGTDPLNVLATGLIDREVRLVMRVVGVAA